MRDDFCRIKLGMRQADVAAILGPPDETRQESFGGMMLTSWVFRADEKPFSVWFDDTGVLRLKRP